MLTPILKYPWRFWSLWWLAKYQSDPLLLLVNILFSLKSYVCPKGEIHPYIISPTRLSLIHPGIYNTLHLASNYDILILTISIYNLIFPLYFSTVRITINLSLRCVERRKCIPQFLLATPKYPYGSDYPGCPK